MNLSQFLSIFKARWWVAVLVLLLTVGTTIAVSLILPKQYTASASVVIDVKPDPIAGQFAGMLAPSYVATQVDVVLSDRVARRVVRNLKLADNPQIRADWLEETGGQGDIEAWVAGRFKPNLDVRPSRESNVISISYRAPDPNFAAALANAFVQAYIDTAIELRVDPAKQYSNFFDQRAKEARDALEKAQGRVSAFQKEKGIIATDERLDIESARLSELSSQLVMIQALAAESGSRQAQARGESGDRLQEVLGNPVIGSLKSDLSRNEARLQELSARLGDNHPQVIESKANINTLRARLDAETKKVTGGVGVTANINRQREAELKASLEAQRAKVLRMKAVRDEGAVLVREMESAQRAYEAVLSRLNQTSLESQATQGNIFVLGQAVPPSDPSSPRVVVNTLLSLVVGMVLAVGAVLALEMLDRRVRAFEDLTATVGLPVLGVMPKPTAQFKLGGKRRLSLMQQRLVNSLPAPQKG
ncbi:MAG: chain length determinant protein EpsF [Burkholderiales bacterium]|nr:chain length determinant protein EpsF [Burkholderiales bacterium]